MVYLHSAITSLSKHFINKALNRVVLPVKQRLHRSDWQICSFVQECNPRYYRLIICDFFKMPAIFPEVKSNFWKGETSKMTFILSLMSRAERVLSKELKTRPRNKVRLKTGRCLQSLTLVGWDIGIAAHHRTFCRSKKLRIHTAICPLET